MIESDFTVQNCLIVLLIFEYDKKIKYLER